MNIPKPTYTEYALLVRAESAEFRAQRAEKALKLILEVLDSSDGAHDRCSQIRRIAMAVPSTNREAPDGP